MKYHLEKVFSGKGAAPHQFKTAIYGITTDEKDLLWAAGDSQIKVFDSQGELISNWSTTQPGFCLEVEGESVYVGQNGQLETYNRQGKLLDTWRDPEKLGRVSAIALLPSSVLVADSLDRCIRRFDRQGNFINHIGKDNRMKGFKIPNGSLDFVVDSNGLIHACNPGKHRIERYTLEGELLGHIGRFDGINPQGFSGCCNPTNVAVDRQGRIYVTEKAGPRAKVYDPEGELIAVIASDIFDLGCKNMDLTIDSLGRVYVVDTVKLLINQFVPDIIEEN